MKDKLRHFSAALLLLLVTVLHPTWRASRRPEADDTPAPTENELDRTG